MVDPEEARQRLVDGAFRHGLADNRSHLRGIWVSTTCVGGTLLLSGLMIDRPHVMLVGALLIAVGVPPGSGRRS